MCANFLKIPTKYFFLIPTDQICTKIKSKQFVLGELKKVLKNSRKRDLEDNILKTPNQETSNDCIHEWVTRLFIFSIKSWRSKIVKSSILMINI